MSDRSRLRTAWNVLLFMVLLARVAVQHTPVVRTVHNLHPHEKVGRLVLGAERLLSRFTSVRIYLNESPENASVPGVTILHSAYAREGGSQDSHRDGVIAFGLIRRYKGLTELVNAYSTWLPPEARPRLNIVGMAADVDYARELQFQSSQVPGVELLLKFLASDELAELVGSSAGAILPYRSTYNSGALWFALSQRTPVLVTRSEATIVLEREFGKGWVRTYEDNLTGEELEAFLGSPRNSQVLNECMKRRDPSIVNVLHSDLYSHLIACDWASRSVSRLRVEALRWVSGQRQFIGHSSRNASQGSGQPDA